MITIDGGTGTILHNGVEIASDKMYDQWRLNVNETITAAGEIVDDWERPTETGSGSYLTIGSNTDERIRINSSGDLLTQGLTSPSFDNQGSNARKFKRLYIKKFRLF